MTIAVKNLVEFAGRPESPLQKIYLRSVHPNAMGAWYSKCPPIDGRSLPNADIATTILRDIAEDFSFASSSSNNSNNRNASFVFFLDTNPIIDPVWDSAEDYCHYTWNASTYEIEYILSKIIQDEWGPVESNPTDSTRHGLPHMHVCVDMLRVIVRCWCVLVCHVCVV